MLPVWPTHQPRCSLVEVKGKTKERTEQESERQKRKMSDLLVRPVESLQNGAGISRKT